jgi:hypothetical protein
MTELKAEQDRDQDQRRGVEGAFGIDRERSGDRLTDPPQEEGRSGAAAEQQGGSVDQ